MKKVKNRFEYVEVDIDTLARAFFENLQSDDDCEELHYQDCFFDTQKRKAIFKILITPDAEKIISKMLDKNGVNLKKENQLDLFIREELEKNDN